MGMTTRTETVYECDHCGTRVTGKGINLVPKGATLGGAMLEADRVFCGSCLCKRAEYKPEPRVEYRDKVVEKVVYQSSSSSGGGWKGPSGRPFPTQAEVLPQGGSWTSCAPGPVTSPAGSAPRSTLLGRLLSCLTPGTSTSASS